MLEDDDCCEDDITVSSKNNAYDPKVGFKVAHKRCDECLFSSAKIVDEDRKNEILKECAKNNNYFLCHKSTIRNDAVVCRGFFDEQSNQACVVAKKLNIVKYVDPNTGEIVLY